SEVCGPGAGCGADGGGASGVGDGGGSGAVRGGGDGGRAGCAAGPAAASGTGVGSAGATGTAADFSWAGVEEKAFCTRWRRSRWPDGGATWGAGGAGVSACSTGGSSGGGPVEGMITPPLGCGRGTPARAASSAMGRVAAVNLK